MRDAGFEPAKDYTLGPKPSPFDHSGNPAVRPAGIEPAQLYAQDLNLPPFPIGYGRSRELIVVLDV